MIKFFFTLAAASCISNFAVAESLKFAGDSISGEFTWLQGPQTRMESVARIQWTSASGAPIPAPGTFRLSLWMPTMGHGSSPTTLEQLKDSDGRALPGLFRITRIYFTMGGLWEVRLTVRFPDGHEETQSLQVTLPGGH